MARKNDIAREMETVVAAAFAAPGQTVDHAARLAAKAICEHLIGSRVYIPKYTGREARNQRVLEAAKTTPVSKIAAAEGLSVRAVRYIIGKQREKEQK